jgi:hypothetical protein
MACGSRSDISHFRSAVPWVFALGDAAGTKLPSDYRISRTVVDGFTRTIHVAADEEWLYEQSPGHAELPVTPGLSAEEWSQDDEDTDEDMERTLSDGGGNDDTIKVSKPLAVTDMTSSPQSLGQSRLSGLFHAWVDTNHHSAPPSTARLTLAGDDAATALADLTSAARPADQSPKSASLAQVRDDTLMSEDAETDVRGLGVHSAH